MAAFRASHDLIEQLRGSNFQIKHFPSTNHRSEVDLNRREARNTDYRRNLTHNMSDAFLLIDIHSFEKAGYGPDVDVVILDDVPKTEYGRKLYDIIKHTTFRYLTWKDVNIMIL
jgi:hypothetical protein